MQSFVTMRFTLFQLVSSDLIDITYLLWKLMIKGEKWEQRYDHGISWTTKDMFQGGEIKDGHGQGSNIKRKNDGSKFLDKRKVLGILNVITKSTLSFLILATAPKMPNLSLMPLKPSCHP